MGKPPELSADEPRPKGLRRTPGYPCLGKLSLIKVIPKLLSYFAEKNPGDDIRLQETWVESLGRKDPLEKEMATHSSTLAWRVPWTEEPGR